MAITHSSSKVKVFQTDNYKIFRKVEGNRAINRKKVDRIIKEIQAGNDILDEVPVLVKESGAHLDVLDGQHRIEVAQKLKRPVHYIVKKKDMSLHNVAKVNSNVEKWKATDFINCYVKHGNKNYEKLKEFHDRYGFAVGLSVVMLTYGCAKSDGSNQRLNELFEIGQFEVKKWKEAVQVAEICKQFEAFPSWNGRPFVMAISKILEADQCDFDVLVKKFKRDPSKLANHATWKDMITNLEVIYNFDNNKRRTIY